MFAPAGVPEATMRTIKETVFGIMKSKEYLDRILD